MRTSANLLMATFCAILMAIAGNAVAQAYPARTVRIIVPFPPGGAIDALGRTLAQKMGESWGQPFVVDNRSGASGIIGTEAGAKSVADGYTLTMGAVSTHAINAVLHRKLPYDPVKDFAPVSFVAAVPNLLVVNPSLPVRSVGDLVSLARQKPGALSYASAGAGTTLHLSGELFKSMARIDVVHVPYKGSGPAVTDLIAGHVPIMFDSVTSAGPHVRAGKLRALGITSAYRSPALPDVPTIAEAGLAGYEMSPWFALFAPAGTPQPVIARLNAEVARIVSLPDVRERLGAMGAEPMGGSPEQLAATMQSDQAKWANVIREANIKVD